MRDSWPRTDFHLHATAHRLGNPRPEMTVPAIVRRGEALGYSHLGIVEHLNLTGKHPVSCLEELVASFRTVRSPLRLYIGAELDVLQQALPWDEIRALKARLGLDYCLGSIHALGVEVTSAAQFMAEYHHQLMRITQEADFVDAIAHPWYMGRSLARRGVLPGWGYGDIPEAMLQEWAQAAAARGLAVELNSCAEPELGDPGFRRLMGIVRDAGTPVSVGSDAHELARVGRTTALEAFLHEMGFPPTQLWLPAGS